MAEVFLSYSREDQATARRFAQALEAEGLEVWWDTAIRPGESFDEVIEQALRAASAVVVLWSPRSVSSRWVRAEATLADRQKTLAPVMIESCERPIMFELTHTADLRHWSDDRDDPAWRALVGDVRRLVEAKKARAAPAAEAAAAGPAPAARRRGEIPAIAILPFTNRSGVADDEVFAEGMVEDVIAALSLSGGVRVLSSTATAAFRKGAVDLDAVGRQLGARYILEGNVRRVGETLRLTSQLVETESGNILWTQRFDRPLAELAALQEELVGDVAAQLGVQVQQFEMERALQKPGDLTAWEAVIRSTATWRSFGLSASPQAVAEARLAVELAPDFGLAQAQLAHALGVHSIWAGADPALSQEARVHAQRAIELDPKTPAVLWRVGRGLWAAGRPQEGREVLERALKLNGNVGETHHALGMAYAALGMADEAIAQFDAGDLLAPQSFMQYLILCGRAYAHLSAGRLAEAEVAVDRSLALNPNYQGALMLKVGICGLLGRDNEALEVLKQEWNPDDTVEVRGRRVSRTMPAETVEKFMAGYVRIVELAQLEPVAT